MKGMTLIVQQIAQLMAPALFLLGAYVIFHGHVSPGGGFAGGVLISGSFAIQLLAWGLNEEEKKTWMWRSLFMLCVGLILFWLVAIWGMFRGEPFFTNFIAKASQDGHGFLSSGNIALCDVAIGILVSSALFSIFLGLVTFEKKEEV